jgi:hypothetical protein
VVEQRVHCRQPETLKTNKVNEADFGGTAEEDKTN